MATQVQVSRLVRDAALVVTKALPGISSTNQSPTIDLGIGPFHPEGIVVEIAYPAMPLHVTVANSVDIKLQDSADDSTYADVSPLTQTSVIGVVTTGSVATVIRIKIPPAVRRYIQFKQTTGVTDTLTTYAMTYSLLT